MRNITEPKSRVFMKRPVIWSILLTVIGYLIAPFISGVLNYPDPLGPLIYPSEYHRILHTIGRAAVGRGETKCPLTERPWFYGLTRKPIDMKAIERRLDEAI